MVTFFSRKVDGEEHPRDINFTGNTERLRKNLNHCFQLRKSAYLCTKVILSPRGSGLILHFNQILAQEEFEVVKGFFCTNYFPRVEGATSNMDIELHPSTAKSYAVLVRAPYID